MNDQKYKTFRKLHFKNFVNIKLELKTLIMRVSAPGYADFLAAPRYRVYQILNNLLRIFAHSSWNISIRSSKFSVD